MAKIKVVLEDKMGSDLKVCRMAKDSFGRETKWGGNLWVPTGEPIPEGHTVTYQDSKDTVASTLTERDKNLLLMLNRGLGQEEFQALLDKAVNASTKEEAAEVLWEFKHKASHRAPFGHNFVTFKFQAPVFVMRQIVKHEYIRLSELSMRYVRGMPEYFYPDDWRTVAANVKQGSGGANDKQDVFNNLMDTCYENDSDMFLRLSDKEGEYKLPPEQARLFLRLTHMTQGHISGSMDAIANLVIQRLDGHAQAETREFARQIYEQMFKPYPLSWGALMEGVKIAG